MIFLFVFFSFLLAFFYRWREKKAVQTGGKKRKVFAVSRPHTIARTKNIQRAKNTNNNTSPPHPKNTTHTHPHACHKTTKTNMYGATKKVRPCDMYVKLCVCCFHFFWVVSGCCVCEDIQHSELKLRFEMQKQVAPFTPNFDFCP